MKIYRYNNATVTKFNNTKIVAAANDKFVKLQFVKLQTDKIKQAALIGYKKRNENLFISFLEFNIGYEGIEALIKTLKTELERHAINRSNTNNI